MRVLITGKGGKAGSWAIRGVQLGAAVGAAVVAAAPDEAADGVDRVVFVKRPCEPMLSYVRRAGIPFGYDAVDPWPQPVGNLWGRDDALGWLRAHVGRIRPAALVGATRQMAADLRDATGLPAVCVPHHARPGQEINPIRERVRVLGYEGDPRYLNGWREPLERACAARGWSFRVNPPSLADLDIVVALRGDRGYAARSWKSNVKLANAQATGTPVICNRDAGYMETASGGERWADDEVELIAAMDDLTDRGVRLDASDKLRASAPTIDEIAREYRAWLESPWTPNS